MRRLFVLFTVILILTGCRSRTADYHDIQIKIEKLSSECPLPMMPYGGIMKIELDSTINVASIYFELNPLVVTESSIENNPSTLGQLIQLICSMPAINDLTNTLIDNKLRFKFVFSCEQQISFIIELTSEELKELSGQDYNTPDIKPMPKSIFK